MPGVDYEFKEKYYGRRLTKGAYFCLYKGLISPKVLENISYRKTFQPSKQLSIGIEEQYIKMNVFLNNAAANNIEDMFEESNDKESDHPSTSNEIQSHQNNDVVDPTIAKLLNSDAFFETIQGSSNDLRNTIKL
jgi:hypothetical protein